MRYQPEITAAATVNRLDPLIVGGLVSTESQFNPWAWNPEPAYRYLWNERTNKPFRVMTPAERASEFPPSDFKPLLGDADQEWWAQQASWGLMQVMGSLARELGYTGPYLPMLCDPATNLQYGCRQLGALFTWAAGDANKALAAYNGGKGGNEVPPYRNQSYATKVLLASKSLS